MNLKDIVCDWEYSRQLLNLGLRREALFRYAGDSRICIDGLDSAYSLCTWMAYTVAELCEMLPESVKTGDGMFSAYSLSMYKHREMYHVSYSTDYDQYTDNIENKKLANALALLLIQMIEENKHVKVEDLNNA